MAVRMDRDGNWHECTSDDYGPCGCAVPTLVVNESDDAVAHSITVDESTDPSDGGAMFAPFCTCPWRGEWQHADNFQDVSDDPADAAYQEAGAEGQAHLDEVAATLPPLKLGDSLNGTIIAHRPLGTTEAVILVWRGAEYSQPFAVARIPADRHVTSWGCGYYHESITEAVKDWQSF